MSFWVYILECADGSYYTGHTEDLEARLAAPELGAFKGYTAKRRPVKLVFCEEFPTRDEAFFRERQLKGWSRCKKQALINRDWAKLVEYSKGKPSLRSPFDKLRVSEVSGLDTLSRSW